MNPFETIERVVPTMEGWCSVEKAFALASVVIAMRPAISVEIGVFAGRSAIPIALAHKYVGHGKLIAIDPWSTEAATEGYSKEHKEWWSKQPLDKIKGQFLNSITTLGLDAFVDVEACKSHQVKDLPAIGLLHVDGQHSMQALRDVTRFTPMCLSGAFCFMDDVSWEGGGPAAGVEWLLRHGWTQRFTLDTGAMFQRIT